MMVHSAEVRWFFEGELPESVLGWFAARQALKPDGPREDRYLLLPDCDTVGVKIRQEKLEIKALVLPPRPLHLGSGISGRTDHWVKWSLNSDALSAIAADLLRSGSWMSVTKERYLRRFSTASGAPAELPRQERPYRHEGCNAELTRIRVDAEPDVWYSLAFEAFGPSSTVARTLHDTLIVFFEATGSLPELSLTGRNSLSYPGWLVAFGRQ